MPPLSLIDAAILLTFLASVLGACHRGIGREMLHTVLFAIAVTGGYVMFSNHSDAVKDADVSFWVMNSLYYLATAYVLTWAAMSFLGPLVIGREVIGLRSRFWAGIVSIVKIVAVVLCLNLWFAMHSTDAHPLRLKQLPSLMQDSKVVNFSDRMTEKLYIWLASRGIVEYHKTLERAPDTTGQTPVPQTYGQQLLGPAFTPSSSQ
jgi:hypothetical protein